MVKLEIIQHEMFLMNSKLPKASLEGYRKDFTKQQQILDSIDLVDQPKETVI